jgi:hypothetical protein
VGVGKWGTDADGRNEVVFAENKLHDPDPIPPHKGEGVMRVTRLVVLQRQRSFESDPPPPPYARCASSGSSPSPPLSRGRMKNYALTFSRSPMRSKRPITSSAKYGSSSQ